MPNPVVHWEIGAKAGKEQRAFYTSLFGWEIKIDQNLDYGMVESGGDGGIGGGIMQVQPDVPSYLSFYVAVDDLQQYLDKAASLGGKTGVGPTPIPGGGAFAMFADPEGNVVGLLKQG